VVCLRPESLREGPGWDLGELRVADAAFLGTHWRAHLVPLRAPALRLVAHLPPSQAPASPSASRSTPPKPRSLPKGPHDPRPSRGLYRLDRKADGVTLISEPWIKPFYRCNLWHVRGGTATCWWIRAWASCRSANGCRS
jgi:hypothetical protein